MNAGACRKDTDTSGRVGLSVDGGGEGGRDLSRKKMNIWLALPCASNL